MKNMDPFIKRFQNHIFQNKLFEKSDKILLGISGGPDSVCLARSLDELRQKYEMELALLHVNYGMRGKDSEKDEKFVRELAVSLGLSLKVVSFSKAEIRGNLEEKMRDFRYCELEKQRRRLKYDWIAVAHTMDDQAETFLMNLFRGSGIVGLGAMQSKKNFLIRPFLFLDKEEIIDRLKSLEQAYRIDKTNLDQKFFRNRIRSKVIPFLEKECGAAIKQNISNAAEIVQQANSHIEKVAKNSYNEVTQEQGDVVRLDIDRFLALDLAVRGYVFRRALAHCLGNIRNVNLSHFTEFMKIIQSKKPKRQKFVFGKVVIERKGLSIEFSRK